MAGQWEVCQQEVAGGHWVEILSKESCRIDLCGSSLHLFITMVLSCRLAPCARSYIHFLVILIHHRCLKETSDTDEAAAVSTISHCLGQAQRGEKQHLRQLGKTRFDLHGSVCWTWLKNKHILKSGAIVKPYFLSVNPTLIWVALKWIAKKKLIIHHTPLKAWIIEGLLKCEIKFLFVESRKGER